jgi:uncharacterized membrane protein YccC
MEPVPFIIASVVGTSLVAAILALWQSHKHDKQAQRAANERCEGRGERLEEEIIKTKELVIGLYRSNAEAAEKRAREAVASQLQLAETARVCARVLKRYEQSPIPPSSKDTTVLTKIAMEYP